MGFRVSGFGFGIWRLGFRARCFGLRVWGSEVRVSGLALGFGVQLYSEGN